MAYALDIIDRKVPKSHAYARLGGIDCTVDNDKEKSSDAKSKKNISLVGLEDLFKHESESVKTEVNFLRWPYFLPDSHVCDSYRSVKISETIQVAGIERQRVWKISPDDELGLPGLFEYKVFLALMRLAEEHIRQYNEVPELLYIPSLYSICKLIGLDAAQGWNKARIKEAIARMGRTQCFSMGAFYNKATNEYMDSNKSFTLITGWGFKGDTQNGKFVEQSYIIFHEAVRQNLHANYVKALDFDFIKALKTDIAPLLYPHLSAVFHDLRSDQEYWEVGYSWLAERLGIKVYTEPWRAKQQLKTAHTELKFAGYLAKDPEWVANGKKIRYYPGLRARYEHERQAYRKKLASKTPKKQNKKHLLISTITETEIAPTGDDYIGFLCFKLSGERSISEEELSKANLTSIEELKPIAISKGFQIK